MDDLIYRQEAIDAIKKNYVIIDLDNYLVEIVKNGKRHSLIEFIEKRINDVLDLRMRDDGEADRGAKIVRCKDCKHYDTHDHRCKVWNHGVIVNGFCYKGEKDG